MLVGTGKYKDFAETRAAIDASGAEIGTASDAAVGMELGCDGVPVNTAIAAAKDPVLMATTMKYAVQAGRAAFLAGRMPRKLYSADRSSPVSGLIGAK